MSITEAIEHMSIDELISALQEMEQLRHSPAWEVIRASLKESQALAYLVRVRASRQADRQ